MCCNKYRLNILYSSEISEVDNVIRVETCNGRYFDLKKDMFSLICDMVDSELDEKERIGLINKNKELFEKSLACEIIVNSISYLEKENTIKKRRFILLHEKSIKSLYSFFSFLVFSLIISYTVFGVLIITLFLFVLDNGLSSISFENIDIYEYICVYILYVFSSIFHEVGHAIMCLKYTGRSKEIGVKINYIYPSFYCNVSPLLLLKSKSERVLISLGGVYFQSLFTIPFLFFMDVNFVKLFLLITTFSILINLYPFIKSDGYWIVSDLLGYNNITDDIICNFFNKKYKIFDVVFFSFFISTMLLLCYFALMNTYEFLNQFNNGVDIDSTFIYFVTALSQYIVFFLIAKELVLKFIILYKGRS